MFAPSFVAGHLIRGFWPEYHFGYRCSVVRDHQGATTLLTTTCVHAERFKTQAINDSIVFSTVSLASLSAGALQHRFGWQTINYSALPALAIILLSLLWLKIISEKSAVTIATNTETTP